MCDVHRFHGDGPERAIEASDLVDELVVSMTNRRIYDIDHPRVYTSLGRLHETIDLLLEQEGGGQVELGMADGYLFCGRRPLVGASLSALRIIEPLNWLDSGGIGFRRGIEREDLEVLVEVLAARKGRFEDFREANEEMRRRGCATISLLPAYHAPFEAGAELGSSGATTPLVAPRESGELPAEATTLQIPRKLYQGIVDLMQDVMVKVCRRDHFSIDSAQGFIEAILRRLDQDGGSMMNICRYEQYDAYTFGHSIRVCFLALNFARCLSRDPALIQRVGLSALLHDVGKAWIPFEILHSRGRLSPAERIEMERHTVFGSEILLGTENADPMAVATAFGHHQTLAGRGYPASLHRIEQSLVTRLVKICDVYEALTAVRPYKVGMSPVRAYRIMMSMDDHFDPVLLRRFVEVNGIYPVGCRVILSSREVARVLEQTDALEQPVVRVEVDPDGERLATEDERILNLRRPEEGEDVSVAGLVSGSELEPATVAAAG